MTEQAYFALSLGPVQDFIATARRCQDLWYGSWLLSEASRRAALAVRREAGRDVLVFPGGDDLDGRSPVANKIVALVPAERVTAVADAAREEVSAFLGGESHFVVEQALRSPLGGYFDAEAAVAQIEELIELQWAAAPCPAEEGDAYRSARRRAEELLAARKNTRTWDPPRWASARPKSSLDGARESVVREALYDEIASGSGVSWDAVRKAFGIRPHERLCGIGVMKRLGEDASLGEDGDHGTHRPVFYSTSHAAAMPLVPRFADPGVRRAFDDYLDVLRDACGSGEVLRSHRIRDGRGFSGDRHAGAFDGALLFEGRLQDTLETYLADGSPADEAADRCRGALRDLLEKVSAEPPAYYALLLADGDRMGALIDAQGGLDGHRRLSRALDGFARSAGQTVREHQGSLIYSGGDDVLAILPLHTAVACARKLADDFAHQLGPYAVAGGPDGAVRPSLSVGLAIAHHLVDLRLVRRQAKRAEQLAKTRRDALAIVLDKRSGGKREALGGWTVADGGLPIDRRLAAWQDLIAAREVSHGFIREIEELGRLVPDEPTTAADMQGVLVSELERIMSRKEPGSRAEVGLDADVREALRRFVADGQRPGDGIAALAAEMTIALELQRVADIQADCAGEQAEAADEDAEPDEGGRG